MAMIEGIAPHPSSWRALVEQLEQETAGRKLAEALLEKARKELEEEQKARIYHESMAGLWSRELEGSRKRIVRLEALILGLHLEQGDEGTGLDTACMELEWEGQRIHGCADSGICDANPGSEPLHGDEEDK